MKTKKMAGAALRLLVLLIMTVITLYPVIWMLSGSMKSDEEFYKNIWGLASAIRPENYASAWVRGALGSKYFNSVFVTALFLVIILPVNCCVAYVIARMQFRGRKFLYMFLLMGMMVPGGVLGMPTFSVALKLKLVDTLYGIALVYCGQAISFGMFLMRSFYISLPKSLEEAAMIDGCTRFRSFVHVILPLTIPGIMTQVVFSGLNTWNEYFMASIMLRTEDKRTLPLGIMTFVGEYNIYYPQLFAALCCATLPIIIVYLLAQKAFVEGLTAGAVKG